MKNKKHIGMGYNSIMLLIGMLWFLLAGCAKFLDKKSDSVLVTPSTINDLQKLLDDTQRMNEAATPSLGEISADDYFIPKQTFNGLVLGYQSFYTWKYFDVGSGNDWSIGYEKIYNANFCLEKINEIEATRDNQQVWNNVIGSALFYRAYYFLGLAWNYAKAYDKDGAQNDLGIALRQSSDFNVPSKRASVEQTYQQIILDAQNSLRYLPNYASAPTRPSKVAAYGLLARTYLSMRDYNNALLYADSCLQLNHQLMNYNGDNDITGDLANNVPFKQLNKETIFYTEMNKTLTLYNTSKKSRVDSSLYLSYDTFDLRKVAFFTKNVDGYEMFKANYTANVSLFFSGIATDEIYLIRGESYIRTGELQKGLDDLNTLLSNRWKTGYFTPVVASSKEKAIDLVLEERRKELLMRGLRWMDIKRQNKEGRNIILKRMEEGGPFILEPNANYYALPLPEDIIRITGMPQNDL